MSQDTSFDPKQEKAKKARRGAVVLIVLALLAFIGYGVFKQASGNSTITLQGQMRLQQSAIASKVPGRIAKILVEEGQTVRVDSPLIEMESPEIKAKIQQAQAGKNIAQSVLDKAKKGARPQEVAQAKAAWHAKQSASKLAQETFQRIDRLFKEGLVSRQKRDEAHTQYLASRDGAVVAREMYLIAKEGARAEDIAAAEAQVLQVDGKLKEALLAQDEANLKSPIAGVVDTVIVNLGEVIGRGVPVLTLVDLNKQWVVLNVTEDKLSYFAIGSEFTGVVPALSSAEKPYETTFKVYASSVLSNFATWRATSDDDGFDMRTFEIKARPTQIDTNVRSGMSVIVRIEK